MVAVQDGLLTSEAKQQSRYPNGTAGVSDTLTEDGHRILFDKYTRRISMLQRMAESVESLTTFGMGPIATSKVEIIRVVDADAGKICLDLDSPDRKLGRDGEYHADISRHDEEVYRDKL